MSLKRKTWAWLSDADRQRTLKFVGGGVVVLVCGIWAAYLRFGGSGSPPDPGAGATDGSIAAGRDVTAEASPGGIAVIASGDVTIGISLEEFESAIRRKERELLGELKALGERESEQRVLLTQQLAAAEAKLTDIAAAFDKQKRDLAAAMTTLDSYRRDFAPQRIAEARTALGRGETAAAEEIFETVLEAGQREASDAAYYLSILAQTRLDLAAAERYADRAVALHPGSATKAVNAAALAQWLGKLEKAQELLEDALRVQQADPEMAPIELAHTRFLLAGVLRDRGRFRDAEEHYVHALDIQQAELESDHPVVINGLNTLAAFYSLQGRSVDAARVSRRILAALDETMGEALGMEDLMRIRPLIDSLTVIYVHQGRYRAVEQLFESLLGLWRGQATGTLDQARVALMLAWSLEMQTRYADAEPAALRARSTFESVLGPDHPESTNAQATLARIYVGQGRHAEARTLFERVIATLATRFGNGHGLTAMASVSLAMALHLSDADGAEALFETSHRALVAAMGANHPSVEGTAYVWGVYLGEQGDQEGADALIRPVLARWDAALDADAPMSPYWVEMAANLYLANDRVEAAAPLVRTGLAMREALLGPDHPDLAVALERYARLLRDRGRSEDAVPLESQAAAIRQRAGAPPPDDELLQRTARRIAELAQVIAVLSSLGAGDASTVATFREVLEVYEEAKGQKAGTAQFAAGFAYYLGQGVEQDFVESAKWFREAAELGHAEAQAALGVQYQFGEGVEQSYETAADWLRKAAAQGFPRAQVQLGMLYEEGLGTLQSRETASEWYRKAADQGDARGQLRLGYLYEDGDGVPQSDAKAFDLYRLAAGQEHADAQVELGVMHATGRGTPEDHAEAARWYRRAAEQDHRRGQCLLGACYEFGTGVEQSYAEAADWYRRSAEQGYQYGLINLGALYESGNGVSKDIDEAVQWYLRAAEQDSPDAQFRLGLVYLAGTDGTRDYERAIAWFEKGAALQHLESQNSLAWILSTASDESVRDGARAVSIIESIAPQGRTPAILDTLAAGYAESGRLEDAIRVQEQALAATEKTDPLYAELQAHLEAYRAGSAWRE